MNITHRHKVIPKHKFVPFVKFAQIATKKFVNGYKVANCKKNVLTNCDLCDKM